MNQWIYTLARWLARVGGAVLVALTAMTVVSIIGRSLTGLGLGPVRGDFELVEMGSALAVFCFLPWCHLKRGHAVVDMLWRSYPAGLRRFLDIATQALMLAVWLLLTWRMAVGMQDYMGNGETTFILQMPVWWGYAPCVVAAVLGCVVYAWTLLEALGLAQPPAGMTLAEGGH
ncbi:MAG: TRAP transporter small permease [Pseudomonadota bacterium]|nr:TRAP transporter small permease [Pseudomonadota bacterium]